MDLGQRRGVILIPEVLEVRRAEIRELREHLTSDRDSLTYLAEVWEGHATVKRGDPLSPSRVVLLPDGVHLRTAEPEVPEGARLAPAKLRVDLLDCLLEIGLAQAESALRDCGIKDAGPGPVSPAGNYSDCGKVDTSVPELPSSGLPSANALLHDRAGGLPGHRGLGGPPLGGRHEYRPTRPAEPLSQRRGGASVGGRQQTDVDVRLAQEDAAAQEALDHLHDGAGHALRRRLLLL